MASPIVSPLVVAHQGSHASVRPNTIDAFLAAAELGADGIELDVRLTGDGEVVVHHDPELDGYGPLCDLPAGMLPAYVPTLRQVLDVFARGVVNVEIKHSPLEAGYDPAEGLAAAVAEVLGNWVRDGGRPERIVVSSFWPPSLDAFRAADVGGVETALLVAEGAGGEQMLEQAASRGDLGLHPHHSLVSARLLERARELAMAVRVWTVDEPERMAALAALGVDAIITNDVPACLTALGRTG